MSLDKILYTAHATSTGGREGSSSPTTACSTSS